MRACLVALFVGCFAVLALTGGTVLFRGMPALAAGLYSIRPSAERLIIRSDGLSTTVVTATVYDDHGNIAPDGTRVLFTTNLGHFDSQVAVTQNGTARVTLTSAEQPGDALIQIVLETPGLSTPSTLTITFSRDASDAKTGNAWARIEGSYVAYIWDAPATIQAIGNKGTASVKYGGLTITADSIQIDLVQNLVKAVGNVALQRGRIRREYRDLRFSLLQGVGMGERLTDGKLHLLAIRGGDLSETPPPAGSPPMGAEMWALDDLSDVSITIVAKYIDLEPNLRVQFHRATFYFDGKKNVTFPFHIIDLGQKTLFEDEIFGLSESGPTVNYPFYYEVQPNSVGTFHIRHGAPLGTASAYATRPGWNLDMTQTYNGPRSTEGSLDIYGITRSGWNAQFRHGQRLDDQTTGSLFVDLSQLSSLFLTSQVARNYPHFQLNGTLSGARAAGTLDPTTGIRGEASGQAREALNAQTYSHTLWGVKQLLYTFSTDTSRQGFYGTDTAVSQATVGIPRPQPIFKASSVDTAVSVGTVTTEGIGAHLYTTPLPIAKGTNFLQSVTLGQQWVQGAAARANGIASSGVSLLGTSSLNHALGPFGSTSLNYDYSQTPQVLTSGIATTTSGTGHQRLGLGLNLALADLWNYTLTGSRGLDFDQTTIYSTLGVHLIGPFRASLILNDSTIQGIHYRDMEYRLSYHAHPPVSRDFSIYYSTTAKRLQFDVSQIGF